MALNSGYIDWKHRVSHKINSTDKIELWTCPIFDYLIVTNYVKIVAFCQIMAPLDKFYLFAIWRSFDTHVFMKVKQSHICDLVDIRYWWWQIKATKLSFLTKKYRFSGNFNLPIVNVWWYVHKCVKRFWIIKVDYVGNEYEKVTKFSKLLPCILTNWPIFHIICTLTIYMGKCHWTSYKNWYTVFNMSNDWIEQQKFVF